MKQPTQGEQGKPDIKAKHSEAKSNLSSERTKPQKSHGEENKSLKIDCQQILEYPQDLLPVDAEFKATKKL